MATYNLAEATKGWGKTLLFYVNGTEVTIKSLDPETTLLDYLRGIGLKGTKLGCGEGGCGACTVVVSRLKNGVPSYFSITACLTPLATMDGTHIITTEYLGDSSKPHAIQKQIAEFHGSQCGFCSPGMVMSLFALLRNKPNPTPEEVEGAFDGNLCRCTGYRPILNAAHTFGTAVKSHKQYSDDNAVDCCMMRDGNGQLSAGCCKSSLGTNGGVLAGLAKKFSLPNFIEPRSDTELIFPPALRRHELRSLALGPRCFRPVDLDSVAVIKHHFPDSALIAGSTGMKLQAEITGKELDQKAIIFIGDVIELQKCTFEENYLSIGANITLTDLETVLKDAITHYGVLKSEFFRALLKQLEFIASPQIRNKGTIAGNLVIAAPNTDLGTFFVASQTELLYRTGASETVIKMENFFTGYGETSLPTNGIIVALRVPVAKDEEKGEFMRIYKQGKRKYFDGAIVNAGLRVSLGIGRRVESVNLVFGGMAQIAAVQAKKTMQYLNEGRKWGEPTVLEGAMMKLAEDFDLRFDMQGGMAAYRKSLALGFFYRFWHEILGILDDNVSKYEDLVGGIERNISEGNRASGGGIRHVAALKQTTGEAQYTDDIPTQAGEVYGCLVLSKSPRAKITVDATPALALPGVIDYVNHTDLPPFIPDAAGHEPDPNYWGPLSKDEPFFAIDEVFSAGQPIGIILAETKAQAIAGAAAIVVTYDEGGLVPILTTEQAIEAKSFFKNSFRQIKLGEPIEEAMKKASRRFKGESRIGGQEHFYLETQCVVVVPKPEDGEIEVFSSTQNPTDTQKFVAQVTGVPLNRVLVRVKRIGGGFGGKEGRSIQLAGICAVAAKKLNRPVRCMLSRHEDMITTGQRNPYYAKWEVGVMTEGELRGKIVALDAHVYSHGGWSEDYSILVGESVMAHIENCYKIPNVDVRTYVCKTNTMSNTAFRGFGIPQGMFIAESYIEEVADQLGMRADELREINMYQAGDKTHYGQPLGGWHVPELFQTLKDEADYTDRRAAVDDFNAKHRYKKRGLALIPSKFGVAFGAEFLNTAGALIHIYQDGSVLVAHGGVEMGQGLHTKMALVAADALGVPVESIIISETATNTVANTSPTAASTASDLNGFAVLNACEQINLRLKPYRELAPNATMKEIATMAYYNSVNLSAYGYYKAPKIDYNWITGVGRMYFYFTQGAALAEVEIDMLTGDWTCLRADIKMDIGRSINPATDYGQIEGGFVQGQGLFTTEESLWNRDGQLATVGPGKYKIPGARDIPQIFSVSMLKDKVWPDLNIIHRSKGVGEPPLFMGSSVFFAIRDALKSARAQNRLTDVLSLSSPATSERIRLFCGDPIGFEMCKVNQNLGEKQTPFPIV